MYQDKLVVNYEGKPVYNIIFDKDFTSLQEILLSLNLKNRRFMIITDTNVENLYLQKLTEILKPIANLVSSFTIEAGESSKNLNSVSQVYNKLIEDKFDRNDIIIALGGGVVGDLAGFAAATYLRGIDFIQVPTTLLAMADSSIGGKTGVDFMAYKNMVGAFHQPKLVYMNLSTLKSLPEREFNSGMSEIIKHGLIKDAEFYKWLKDNMNEVKSLNYEALKQMVIRSCKVKKDVVEADPKEKGERALLNFGHTIGHAIEKLYDFKLLHGECVAIGMVAAAYISCKRSFLSESDLEDISKTIMSYGLPVKISGLSPEEIYTVTKLDKKMESDKIKYVYLEKIGKAVIDTTVSKDEIIDAINFVLTKDNFA